MQMSLLQVALYKSTQTMGKNPRAVFWISHYSDEKLTFFLEQGHFTALNAPVTDG